MTKGINEKVADGVIVGSAIVKKIKDNIGRQGLIKRVIDFISGLKNGTGL